MPLHRHRAALPHRYIPTQVPIEDEGDDGYYNGGFQNDVTEIVLANDGTARKGYFYFPDVPIPQGSIILAAALFLTASTSLSNVTVNLKLVAADEDTPAVPTDVGDADGRPRTDAEVYWNNVEAWVANVTYESPDISTIMQELVNRAGFGQAVLMFAEDNGSTANASRKVRSYKGDPAQAAKLYVEWYTPPSSDTQPAAPSLLAATAITGRRIDLSWTDNSDNEAGFRIERSADALDWAQIGTAAAGATTYQDTSLVTSGTYYYRVRSYNGWGNSDYSNTANATTIFCPADIADLELWLDGTVGTYQDAAKTTPATADTDPVGAWADQSGHGRDMTQAVAGSRGTLQAAEINGLNVIEFDGIADYLENGDAFLDSEAGAVFAVVNVPAASTLALSSSDEASDSRYVLIRLGLGPTNPYMEVAQRNADTEDGCYGSTEVLTNETLIMGWFSTGTAYRLRLNGSEEVIRVRSGSNTGDWFGDASRRDNTAVAVFHLTFLTQYLDGQIAELFVYSSVPSQADIDYLEAGLATKWGVTLSTPVARQGTLFDPGGEPSVIYEGSPQILIGEPVVFKMWYGGIAGASLSYAESVNGTDWTEYGSNPVLGGTMVRPHVTKIGATYYLYIVNATGTQMDLYTSADGLAWALDTASVLTPGAAGQWDDGLIANCCVWLEGATYYMLYEARQSGGSVWKIGLATSADGKAWAKNGANPVISESVSNGRPNVHKVGATYYLFHHRSTGLSLPLDTYRRTSTDLITWSYPTLILQRATADEGAGSAVGQAGDVSVVEVGGSTYLFYVATTDGATPVPSTIKLATYATTMDGRLAPRAEP